jgi:cytochrome c553
VSFGRGAAAVAAALFLFPALANADAEAGKAKAAICAACHGEGGNSPDRAVPSIAGQPAQMIATQLYQFREGNRTDPVMSPMAAKLSNADMNDLAAYFSSQKMAPPKHQAAAENAAAGPELAKKFNCSQCHGGALMGQQHIPRLAGQQVEYLRAQLKLFKAGKRADMDGNMTAAARPLSDKDIDVLADYLAGLGATN